MIFLKKLSKKERTFLYLVIAVIGLALLDHFLLKPSLKRLNDLENKIMIVKKDLVQDKMILRRKDEIHKEYQKYLSEYPSFFEPPKERSPEMSELFKEIDTLVKKAKITVLSLKETREKEKFRVTLECEGKNTEITHFLYEVSKSYLPLRIEKVDLSPKPRSKTDEIKCYMTISKMVIPEWIYPGSICNISMLRQ